MSDKVKYTDVDRYKVEPCSKCNGETSLPVDVPFMKGHQTCPECHGDGYTVTRNKWIVFRTLAFTIGFSIFFLATMTVWIFTNHGPGAAIIMLVVALVAMFIAEMRSQYVRRLITSVVHLWKEDQKELAREIAEVKATLNKQTLKKLSSKPIMDFEEMDERHRDLLEEEHWRNKAN